ncbi:MAG: polyribonucleotide nucleotidyltransferase [Candidatus Omnitrophica bacterium]|nr:polyribonucleotide nucleotidyltransferase [Candidatus Omnitrophota bacterium]
MITKVSTKIGNKDVIIETGIMAKQADGAVTVTCGETVILVTAVMSRKPREGADFFPLFVEYQEKTYAAGRIPGGYFKREGRPTEREILTARLIDRPLRPLFPEGMANEVQIMAMVISSDGETDPDVLAVVGASAAVAISGMPCSGPVGAVRIGRKDDEFIVNPTYVEQDESEFDLIVCATEEGVIMIEAGAKEASEDILVKAIELGFEESQKLIKLQKDLASKCAKKEQKVELKKIDPGFLSKVKEFSGKKLTEINSLSSKDERIEMMDILSKELVEKFVTEEGEIKEPDVTAALNKIEKELVRGTILNEKKRVDNRGFEDVRDIECKVGVLPRTHGSGLFTRGQTQSFSVITLGTSSDEQRIEALQGEAQKTFMLHYNFPPFSVGEVKPVRGPGRREIGHGALAERALLPMMPTKEEFPYTVRIVSDILESNGSSSMATACAGSLALMDAGVPLKKAVSGIAMGLVKEGDNFVILTDIAGLEDHYGDMDFKVAGTSDGITAMQVDLKLKTGITMEIVRQALDGANKARLSVLDKMNKVIAKPKESMSMYAPRITTLKISTDKIKDVIGPGGKIIRKIIADTGVTIDIEDDGTINVASNDGEALNKALEIIGKLTEEPEVGKIYNAKVMRIMNFGAFCEIIPGKEGLVHVSELSDTFVKNVEDVVKVGDELLVKLVEIDDQGRLNLSHKKAKGESKDEKQGRDTD